MNIKLALQPFLSQDVAAGLSQNTTATQSTFATTRKYTKHPSAAVGSGEFCFLWSLDTVIVPVAISLREIIPREQIRDLPFTVKNNGAVHGLPQKLVRLFHFLFEMLENPNMAHCLSWVPAAAGVFRFSSRNKDQVAALWGQRKGNKRPMTYQKMSRALRNYARSGEIFKVKKKLTYQFSRDTLMLLQKCHRRDL
uniref:Transcription factor Spi-C n=1 Tax=Amphilophus citrinellus TaxID=61819 RepID=A0A3Q0QW13_AMPCI